ncbi:MAG: TetR/AcrR family transcriptional regulator [Lachnospiraceae bacterium]|nr:TetR/AcrR family transcriptional regulator [Lachnospiraceae bacterium]
MKKQSKTAKHTRQCFLDAFWSLLGEKPISKIAVNELTRRTTYNRGTFYEYFLDIDDLVANAEAELLEEVKQTILQVMPETDSLGHLFQIVFTAMNEKLYLLLGPNGDSAFFSRVKSELLPLVEEYLPVSPDMPYFDYLMDYVNSAVFSLLKLWNERGKDLSTDEISALMQNLVLHGLMDYIPSDALIKNSEFITASK